MLKITIAVTENKGKGNCKVDLINPKDLSKGTDNEKNVTAMVINAVTKALEDLGKMK